MRIDVTTPSDFSKFYQESFVRSKMVHKGVVWINGVIRDDVVVRFVGETGAIGETQIIKFPSLQDHIYFGLPPLGMTVYRDMLFYMAQNFNRSGSRGLSRHRGHIHALSQNAIIDQFAKNEMVRGLNMNILSYQPAFSRAVLWPEYTGSFKVSTKALLEGDVAATAIDRSFGGYLSEKLKYPVFCYKSHRIGEIVDVNKIAILPSYQGFKDLVVHQAGPEVTVV